MGKPNGRLRAMIKRLRPAVTRSPRQPRARHHIPDTAYGIAVMALTAFGAVAAAVTVIAIVESYSNLLAFALDHGLHGWRAAIAPGAVDSFIILGELLLFAALLLDWGGWTAYVLGGAMVVWGFSLSVGGNVWHASSASGVDRAVAAIWPVTATAGLAGGLIIIKRVMAARSAGPAVVPVAAAKTPPAPSSRERDRRRVVSGGQARTTGLAVARDVQAQVILDLMGARPLPSISQLVTTDARLNGSRRTAASLLRQVRSQQNGTGSDHGDGS